MAVEMNRQLMAMLPELRYQPVLKRVRVALAGEPVADTRRAVLVWEPTRVVPSYAVPGDDVIAGLVPATAGPPPAYRAVGFGDDGPPVLDPSIPFAVHTAAGDVLDVVTAGGRAPAGAFRLTDDDVPGLVVLHFDAFQWWEEDEPIVGHARDPFHRIDVRASSSTVRLEHDGHVLAESRQPRLLFEAAFPLVRYYLPAEDVRVELRRGTLDTTCAYKGHATHLTAVVPGGELPDIAWTYANPLDDALAVRGLVCFYQERTDLWLDGQPVPRVRTPWS